MKSVPLLNLETSAHRSPTGAIRRLFCHPNFQLNLPSLLSMRLCLPLFVANGQDPTAVPKPDGPLTPEMLGTMNRYWLATCVSARSGLSLDRGEGR